MDQTERHIYIAGLISKLLTGSITIQEKQELDNWLNEDEKNKTLFKNLTNAAFLEQELKQDHPAATELVWQNIYDRIEPETEKPVKRLLPAWIGIAASLLIIGASALFFIRPNQQQPIKTAEIAQPSAAVHTAQPMLILGNGKTVALNQNGSVNLREKDGTVVSSKNAVLSYQNNTNTGNQENIVYNTLIVPKGAQYQLVLADGSKVWMNSASTLRYPTAFNTNSREVYLTGEAYFEVVHNAASPFRVKTDKAEVQVLGTHFNVMAYEDEDVCKTTLLQGLVSVQTKAGSQLVKPGQQDEVSTSGIHQLNTDIDLDEEMAWKNGLFFFKDAGIQEIMRQAARWYDIRVVYEGPAPDIRFSGKMSRKVNSEGLVNILKYAGFHINTEGKTLHITK